MTPERYLRRNNWICPSVFLAAFHGWQNVGHSRVANPYPKDMTLGIPAKELQPGMVYIDPSGNVDIVTDVSFSTTGRTVTIDGLNKVEKYRSTTIVPLLSDKPLPSIKAVELNQFTIRDFNGCTRIEYRTEDNLSILDLEDQEALHQLRQAIEAFFLADD